MSEQINDGGPAFPAPYNNDGVGMSLRDWFAGQALVALPHTGCGGDLHIEDAAKAAYQMADAMLKARGGAK